MCRLFFILLLVPAVAAQAQFTYVADRNTIVKDQAGNTLKNPWGGGLNATQYNTMDLNGDGTDDLVLFDRMSNSLKTFLTVDRQYEYSPEYQAVFPEGLVNWVLLRDFNCDGRKDIFTADVLGIKVFINRIPSGSSDQIIDWHPYLFTSSSGSKSRFLLTKGFSTKVNLQLQFDDLPAVYDADGDGDLDIFNMHFGTGETIELHKNFSMERYGTCDSLDFERITQNWGNVKECHCMTFAFDEETCDEAGGRIRHSGGKSLLAFDENGDGNTDILFSEAGCSDLFLLRNEGTSLDADVNSVTVFPAATPFIFVTFPAAFYEDVDFDGVKDLICSTNLYIKEDLHPDLAHSSWFYKNTGSNQHPEFTFITDNFLQAEMIDVGDNAIPAFADHDGDGDLDLLVSRHSSVNGPSTIFLYENTGTVSSPEFTLLNEDFLEFSSRNFYNVKIHLVDIDHNASTDLVFSGTRTTDNRTDLYFIANRSTSRLDFTGQTVTQLAFNLTAQENLGFTDADQDGFTDILAGRSNGKLEYWKNNGDEAISFSLADDNFLDVQSNTPGQNISCAAGDLNSDGKPDLVYSDQPGLINIIRDYRNETNRTAPESEIVFNEILDEYTAPDPGGRQWPVIANIFNTDKPAIVSGTTLGGITILQNDGGKSLPAMPRLDVFPNPLQKNVKLKIKSERPVSLLIYDPAGRQVTRAIHIPSSDIFSTDLDFLSAGLYILKFHWGRSSIVRRLVIY